jgi:hypothetical protein
MFCVNEPFAHKLTLREEGQVELLGRRPTDLARVRLCQTAKETVNAILRADHSGAEEVRQLLAARTLLRGH